MQKYFNISLCKGHKSVVSSFGEKGERFSTYIVNGYNIILSLGIGKESADTLQKLNYL